jgi:hypothetical protein
MKGVRPGSVRPFENRDFDVGDRRSRELVSAQIYPKMPVSRVMIDLAKYETYE